MVDIPKVVIPPLDPGSNDPGGSSPVPPSREGAGYSTVTLPVHSHAMTEIVGLVTALAGKAATSHTHAIADVTSLQAALDGKAASSHSHAQSDVTGLVAALALLAPLESDEGNPLFQPPEETPIPERRFWGRDR